MIFFLLKRVENYFFELKVLSWFFSSRQSTPSFLIRLIVSIVVVVVWKAAGILRQYCLQKKRVTTPDPQSISNAIKSLWAGSFDFQVENKAMFFNQFWFIFWFLFCQFTGVSYSQTTIWLFRSKLWPDLHVYIFHVYFLSTSSHLFYVVKLVKHPIIKKNIKHQKPTR